MILSHVGFLALLVTIGAFSILCYLDYDVSYINKHWLQLVTASIVSSAVLSVALYMKALYADDSELAPESTGRWAPS